MSVWIVVVFSLVVVVLLTLEWYRKKWLETVRVEGSKGATVTAATTDEERFWLALGESDPMTHRSTIGIHIAKDVATGGSIVLPITPDTPVNCLQLARAQRIQDPASIFIRGHEESGNRMYIRESAHWLWEEILMHKKEYFDDRRAERYVPINRLILTGNSGVGESMNVIQYIWHLLHPGPGQDRPTIVYQDFSAKGECWVLKGARYEDWRARRHVPDLQLSDISLTYSIRGSIQDLLQDPSTWYFIDAPMGGEFETQFECFALCVAPLTALESLKKFRGNLPPSISFVNAPIWTLDDLEMARFCCYPTSTERIGSTPMLPGSTTQYVQEVERVMNGITQARMQFQFGLVGGLIRYVLTPNVLSKHDFTTELHLSRQMIEKILSTPFHELIHNNDANWFLHRVVRVVKPSQPRNQNELPFREKTLQWSSPYLTNYFYKTAVALRSQRINYLMNLRISVRVNHHMLRFPDAVCEGLYQQFLKDRSRSKQIKLCTEQELDEQSLTTSRPDYRD